jgi:hypothetical protein
MENLVELNERELKVINGGGWWRELVADLTYRIKCGCAPGALGNGPRNGYYF